MALLEARVTSQPMVFSRPAPFPGCKECREMDDAWVAATTPGTETLNPSKASDIVVLMRRHKSAVHGGPK
jgi:hypothetical protein